MISITPLINRQKKILYIKEAKIFDLLNSGQRDIHKIAETLLSEHLKKNQPLDKEALLANINLDIAFHALQTLLSKFREGIYLPPTDFLNLSYNKRHKKDSDDSLAKISEKDNLLILSNRIQTIMSAFKKTYIQPRPLNERALLQIIVRAIFTHQIDLEIYPLFLCQIHDVLNKNKLLTKDIRVNKEQVNEYFGSYIFAFSLYKKDHSFDLDFHIEDEVKEHSRPDSYVKYGAVNGYYDYLKLIQKSPNEPNKLFDELYLPARCTLAIERFVDHLQNTETDTVLFKESTERNLRFSPAYMLLKFICNDQSQSFNRNLTLYLYIYYSTTTQALILSEIDENDIWINKKMASPFFIEYPYTNFYFSKLSKQSPSLSYKVKEIIQRCVARTLENIHEYEKKDSTPQKSYSLYNDFIKDISSMKYKYSLFNLTLKLASENNLKFVRFSAKVDLLKTCHNFSETCNSFITKSNCNDIFHLFKKSKKALKFSTTDSSILEFLERKYPQKLKRINLCKTDKEFFDLACRQYLQIKLQKKECFLPYDDTIDTSLSYTSKKSKELDEIESLYSSEISIEKSPTLKKLSDILNNARANTTFTDNELRTQLKEPWLYKFFNTVPHLMKRKYTLRKYIYNPCRRNSNPQK